MSSLETVPSADSGSVPSLASVFVENWVPLVVTAVLVVCCVWRSSLADPQAAAGLEHPQFDFGCSAVEEHAEENETLARGPVFLGLIHEAVVLVDF